MLRPPDVLVVAKLAANSDEVIDYASLGRSLGLSKAAAHNSVRRAQNAGLISVGLSIRRRAVAEMLVFGVRYFVPTHLGAESRGIPTSHGVSPLLEHFGVRDDAPVWPATNGKARGPSIEPIYETVPLAIAQDERLHSLLALVDALRIGRAREINLAKAEIQRLFEVPAW